MAHSSKSEFGFLSNWKFRLAVCVGLVVGYYYYYVKNSPGDKSNGTANNGRSSATDGAVPVPSENETAAKDPVKGSHHLCTKLASKNAGEAVDAKPSSSFDNQYIRLRLINSDMTDVEEFKVKLGSSLGHLKRLYCAKIGYQGDGLRFVFDGHRISDDDTPMSLYMENDDVIEIYRINTGGGGV